MNKLKITGGVRIGMANATWPLATLTVDRNELEVKAFLIGNLAFQPADIVALEAYTQIPLLGQGIKIKHRVETYDEKVIFWTFKDPESVIDQIRQTGFLSNRGEVPAHASESIRARQKSGGSPIKKSVVIGAIVLWNLLFLLDVVPLLRSATVDAPIGNGTLSAVGLLFVGALLSLISEDFRGLVLKEGRSLEDIKGAAIFLACISGFMFLLLGWMSKLAI